MAKQEHRIFLARRIYEALKKVQLWILVTNFSKKVAVFYNHMNIVLGTGPPESIPEPEQKEN